MQIRKKGPGLGGVETCSSVADCARKRADVDRNRGRSLKECGVGG